MAVAFAVMSLLNWWHDGHSWRWIGGIAAFFLAVMLLHPAALKPLNRLWLKFGLLLSVLRHGAAYGAHHAGAG
jgi:O-antigen ligase